MEIIRKYFGEPSTDELYFIMQLREEVFVVWHDCPYQYLDGNGRNAVHLFAKDGDGVAAYLRVFLKYNILMWR